MVILMSSFFLTSLAAAATTGITINAAIDGQAYIAGAVGSAATALILHSFKCAIEEVGRRESLRPDSSAHSPTPKPPQP